MKTLEKIANKIRQLTIEKEERSNYSAGYWPCRLRQETLKLCRDLKGELLEVGCGEGLFLSALAIQNQSLKLTGIDNCQERLTEAQKRLERLSISSVRLSLVDAEKLPFADNSFDAVICINTLFNLDSLVEVRRFLKELCRVCKPQGKVILDMRNRANPAVFFKYKFAKYYDSTLKVPVRAYRLRAFQDILEGEGLFIEKKASLGALFYLIPAIILIQAKNAKLKI